MITRIVRMTFRPDEVDNFLRIFNATKSLIRHFEGVKHLELHRDAKEKNVFYTYSIWEGEAALEAYRHSDLFINVWGQTKQLFAEKPQAFSLVQEMKVD